MSAAFMKRRVPAYMGGLLLSLGAMIVIMQAKQAFAPTFHEIEDERSPAIIASGGSLKIVYDEEPGHFLPPGFPTMLVISKKEAGGFQPMLRLSYGNLLDRENIVGPLIEEGDYLLEGSFHICAAPGVADCAKLTVKQAIQVKAGGEKKESRLFVDLPKLANAGLEAGKIKSLGK
jgi:hypothetical protein